MWNWTCANRKTIPKILNDVEFCNTCKSEARVPRLRRKRCLLCACGRETEIGMAFSIITRSRRVQFIYETLLKVFFYILIRTTWYLPSSAGTKSNVLTIQETRNFPSYRAPCDVCARMVFGSDTTRGGSGFEKQCCRTTTQGL